MAPPRSCSRVASIFSLIALTSLAAPPPAAAEGRLPGFVWVQPSSNVPSFEDRAKVFEREAKKALAQNRKRDAADLYEKAWNIYKHARFICARGSILFGLGHYREAAAALHTCKTFSISSHAGVSETFLSQFDKARAEICTIHVTMNVTGPDIFVANKWVARAPVTDPIFVEPGTYLVEARAPGYPTDGKTIACEKGWWREVNFVIQPPARPEVIMPQPVSAPRDRCLLGRGIGCNDLWYH